MTVFSGNTTEISRIGEFLCHPKKYRCHLAITQDSDAEWSAVVLNLPGTGSCGASKEEAIANVREAILAAVESYGDDIPWLEQSEYELPADAQSLWILVDG